VRRRGCSRHRTAVLAGCAALLTACSGAARTHPAAVASHPPSRARTSGVRVVPTGAWRIRRDGTQTAIEGFASRTDVLPGQPVTLYVSTTASSFRVTAFRMGLYPGGHEAARVWQSRPQRGVVQPAARMTAATRTVYAPWRPSLTVSTTGWPAGDYLFLLSSSAGYQRYVPLTLRSPSTAGKVVLMNDVTTWQAYNTWGGRSLYVGPGGFAGRSYAVTFDRPYDDPGNDGDWLGLDAPVLFLADRLHIPLAYETDVDLATDPGLLNGARAVLSLGHDEYYSQSMRTALTVARSRGTNIAFFGANAIYRHIRFAPTRLGPDRLVIDYKSFTLDPIHTRDPAAATTFAWEDPPDPRPESVLTGAMYQCNPVHVPLVVADASSWLLRGLGVRDGESLRSDLVGPEYDAIDLADPTPRPIESVFHSPLACGTGLQYADVSYYTTSSGAAVFDAGTSKWVCALQQVTCGPGWGGRLTDRIVTAVTSRILTAFAAGPAGRAHPAVSDLGRLGIR
jgi:hypothetical protein